MKPTLLFLPELAQALRRSEWYVYQMKRAGFKMPGGTATLAEARQWLLENDFKTTPNKDCQHQSDAEARPFKELVKSRNRYHKKAPL